MSASPNLVTRYSLAYVCLELSCPQVAAFGQKAIDKNPALPAPVAQAVHEDYQRMMKLLNSSLSDRAQTE